MSIWPKKRSQSALGYQHRFYPLQPDPVRLRRARPSAIAAAPSSLTSRHASSFQPSSALQATTSDVVFTRLCEQRRSIPSSMLGSSTAAEFTHLADGARAAAIAAAWSPHTAVVAKEVVVVPDGSRGVRELARPAWISRSHRATARWRNHGGGGGATQRKPATKDRRRERNGEKNYWSDF